ncbi:MAG: hypothetical protein WD071_01735 [Pseudohongiella sp.]|uniref:hypothetical protein n=1 Tax=Pseudohongiella sp. TaxID=1979412 RepID=UPI00349FF844
MKFFTSALFWTLTLLLPVAEAQESAGERAVIEILSIIHRDPSRVRDMVDSALDPRGSIGQIDNKLVIATTEANLRQLKEMIADTDVPPRRLIIGVDFAYQSDTTDSSDLQSDQQDLGLQDLQEQGPQESQAIEGEELVFVAGVLTGDGNSDNRRVTIAAEIIDGNAAVNLVPDNVTGIMGSLIITVPLGVWQVINPPLTGADSEEQSIPQAVAVRVDRVP